MAMKQRFADVKTAYYPLKGGLDLVNPAITKNPGTCFDAKNYEPGLSGGYRRINGFERSDGRPSPSAASYWLITANITGSIAVGNTVTGATSTATGKVLAISGSTLVLGRVSGTFQSGENLQVAAVTQAVSTSTASANSAADYANHVAWRLLAADDRRADITTVPGSGDIRGVFVFGDVVYAFRDNVGATAGNLYKQTAGGWSQVTFGREMQFVARSSTVTITIAAPGVVTWNGHGLANGQTVVLTTTGALPGGLTAGTTYYVVNAAANTFELAATAGGASITTTGTQSGTHTATLTSATGFTAGQTVTGASSGASAVIVRVLLRTGTWASAPVGTLVFATVTGAFTNGEALQLAGVTQVQANGADSAITRAAGGRVETVLANYSGSAATKRIYGADGVNLGFEFDGTNYVPIRTGMTTDTPSHVETHKNCLWYTFGSSLQKSSVNQPYAWTVVTGAAEFAMGDTITGIRSVKGNDGGAAMLVSVTSTYSVLYGSSSSDFNLVPSGSDLGFEANTIQPVGNDVFGLTAQGIQSLVATQAYGSFNYAAVSTLVQPYLSDRAGLQTASVSLKAKNQYRLFFSDNSVLVVGLTGGKISGSLTLDYGKQVKCICNARLSTGEEVTYFGSTDGYVYKDNVGTSFDGAEIEAWIRPVFNNLQSPLVRKTFLRAVFEVESEGYARVNATYDLGYGSPDVSAAATQDDQAILGAGSYWDQFNWDDFIWDAPVVANAYLSIDGTENNISFMFYSSRNQDDPHTVQGVNLQYVPRRLTRGGA
jgi:hypothetical protein